MSRFTPVSYQRLGGPDPDAVDNSVVEFMETLCEFEERLLQFEGEVAAHEIGLTGLQASTGLSSLEQSHYDQVTQIRDAYEAVVTGHLKEFSQYPAEHYHHRTKNEVFDYRHHLLEMIVRLESISDRIGRRIDAKRNSANTRLVFSVSCIAVVIALISLVG